MIDPAELFSHGLCPPAPVCKDVLQQPGVNSMQSLVALLPDQIKVFMRRLVCLSLSVVAEVPVGVLVRQDTPCRFASQTSRQQLSGRDSDCLSVHFEDYVMASHAFAQVDDCHRGRVIGFALKTAVGVTQHTALPAFDSLDLCLRQLDDGPKISAESAIRVKRTISGSVLIDIPKSKFLTLRKWFFYRRSCAFVHKPSPSTLAVSPIRPSSWSYAEKPFGFWRR